MEMLLSINWSDTGIVASIIGVIGTLLGTFAGYLLSTLTKIKLKKFIIKNLKYMYTFGLDETGSLKSNKEIQIGDERAKKTRFNAEIYLINPSGIIFNMNDLKLIIKNGNVEYKANLNNVDARKNSNGIITTPHIDTISIKEQTSLHLNIEAIFSEAIEKSNSNKYYLEFLNIKGKIKRKKLLLR